MDITSTLKAVVMLDSDGQRILASHFTEQTNSKQFERKLFVKTKSLRIKDEILVIDDFLVIHRFVTSIHFYVIGSKDENPLMLDAVLNCLVEVVTSLSNKVVERQSVMDNLSQVILAMDEICDNGLVLETDSNLVLQRICLKDDMAEQSMAQKIQSATEQFKFPWIRS